MLCHLTPPSSPQRIRGGSQPSPVPPALPPVPQPAQGGATTTLPPTPYAGQGDPQPYVSRFHAFKADNLETETGLRPLKNGLETSLETKTYKITTALGPSETYHTTKVFGIQTRLTLS